MLYKTTMNVTRKWTVRVQKPGLSTASTLPFLPRQDWTILRKVLIGSVYTRRITAPSAWYIKYNYIYANCQQFWKARWCPLDSLRHLVVSKYYRVQKKTRKNKSVPISSNYPASPNSKLKVLKTVHSKPYITYFPSSIHKEVGTTRGVGINPAPSILASPPTPHAPYAGTDLPNLNSCKS